MRVCEYGQHFCGSTLDNAGAMPKMDIRKLKKYSAEGVNSLAVVLHYSSPLFCFLKLRQ